MHTPQVLVCLAELCLVACRAVARRMRKVCTTVRSWLLCRGDHPSAFRFQPSASARGEDSNKRAQLQIIEDILSECEREQIDESVIDKMKAILEESDITQLTEFGRVVHAEMEALLSCARKGLSTRKATIYCTTFPCHNCAKHIIAAGIERVVFVEPYLKSKAKTHHDEIIKIEYPAPAGKPINGTEEVRFEPFFGVGPRRFFDLFSMNLGIGTDLIRKNGSTGAVTIWKPKGAKPRIQMAPRYYLATERRAEKKFSLIVSSP